MGVSLSYFTTGPVPSHVQDAIQSEAQCIAPENGWWAEPINFWDSGKGDGRLHGKTKVFLTGYSTNDGGYVEVDGDDDCLMAFRDTSFVVERLAEWSKQYELVWQIDCVGQPVGMITDGQCDHQLRGFIEAMKKSFSWPSSFGETVCAISAKYASRW